VNSWLRVTITIKEYEWRHQFPETLYVISTTVIVDTVAGLVAKGPSLPITHWLAILKVQLDTSKSTFSPFKT
jgi:hypothetical protein